MSIIVDADYGTDTDIVENWRLQRENLTLEVR